MDLAAASNAAANVMLHTVLSGFQPSPGAVLHQDAQALCLQMEHASVAAGVPTRQLAAVRGVGGGEDRAPRWWGPNRRAGG